MADDRPDDVEKIADIAPVVTVVAAVTVIINVIDQANDPRKRRDERRDKDHERQNNVDDVGDELNEPDTHEPPRVLGDHLVQRLGAVAGLEILVDGRAHRRRHKRHAEQQPDDAPHKAQQVAEVRHRPQNRADEHLRNRPADNDNEASPPAADELTDLDTARRAVRGAPGDAAAPLKRIAQDGDRPHDGHEARHGADQHRLPPALILSEKCPAAGKVAVALVTAHVDV